jgi:hypothetical protein
LESLRHLFYGQFGHWSGGAPAWIIGIWGGDWRDGLLSDGLKIIANIHWIQFGKADFQLLSSTVHPIKR